jgi:hypothetical protein
LLPPSFLTNVGGYGVGFEASGTPSGYLSFQFGSLAGHSEYSCSESQ